jgi:hypothetical protein
MVTLAFIATTIQDFAAMFSLQRTVLTAAGLVSVLISSSAFAGPAPAIFYAGEGGYFYSRRFSTPDEAGRYDIERLGYSNWSYSHVEPYTSGTSDRWHVFYMHTDQNGIVTGPHQAGSTVARYWACDLTPMIGPGYASDAQGKPKNHSSNRDYYPSTGCPTIEVDASKTCPEAGTGKCNGKLSPTVGWS